MEISRREFLKMLGVSTAGAALAGLGCDTLWSVPDKIYEKIGGAPRIETWKTSVCSLCPGGCGIKVRLIDGIPVRVLGNPLHPVNRGGICPMGEAGVESLFNPDRIKSPLRRIGERGEGKWESLSWEEALQIVTSRFSELREKKQAHKLVFWTRRNHNLLSGLIERFMQAYGSPNRYFFDENRTSGLVTYLSQGHQRPLGYNFQDLQLLMNFGADLLDAGPTPIRFNQIYSELRNREAGRSVRIIHFDSRLSRTAGNSNEWVPVLPGTMAALALGLANVMIKDQQYDANFVRTNSFGFDDWTDEAGNQRQGFKTFVTREYYPEKVAEITGIEASKIIELARELGAANSALVLAGGQAANSTNSLYTLWAIESLNALKGNFKGPGPLSLVPQPPFADLPQAQLDEIALAGLSQTGLNQFPEPFWLAADPGESLVNMMSGKEPDPVEILFISGINPLFTSINQTRLAPVIDEVPFIVSFSAFVDETSMYADLILPDHTFLEKHEIIFNLPMVEYSHFGLQQPVITPLYDSRHIGDMILQISQQLGGAIAASLPWGDYKEYLQYRLEGVYTTGAGTIFSERIDEAWLKFLKERGWQIFAYTSAAEFWEVLSEKGGWWDPFPPETDFSEVFETPSAKFEFYSQILYEELYSRFSDTETPGQEIEAYLKKHRIESRGDTVFLPHFETPRFYQPEEQFDLHLLTYRLITNADGSGSNLPLMQELFGMLTREYWNSWIEINPETARHRGISDGDMVNVTSPKGSLRLKAKLLPGVMPGMVYVPFGLGHKAYGRYAREIGVNPYEILQEDYDFLNGNSSLISTKVKLQKVNKEEYA
jgi:anaerobic selenocysteine-containing dehydrogenase